MIHQKIISMIAQMAPHNRVIFSAAAIIAIITMAIKFVAMFKELVVANNFGTSEILDAFLIAYLIPSFAISIFAGNFSAAVIPPFIEIRKKEGETAARKYLATIMASSLVLLFIIAALLALSGPLALSFLTSNFSLENQSLSLSLYLILLPLIVIEGLIDIFSAVLNAGEKFVLAAFAPLFVPLFVLFSLLIFSSEIGIYAYVYGEIAGVITGLLLLGIGLKKYKLFTYPKWNGFTLEVKQTMKQYVPLISGAMLICSAPVIDIAMASMLEPGSVSSLAYGNKVVSVIMMISALALSTALLPYFSSMIADRDWESVHRTIQFFLKMVFLATLPIMVLCMIFSEQIVGLLFERGEFTEQDTAIVGQILFFYLLQMPFFIANMIWTSLISSLKVNQILLYGNIITIALNITGNYYFMQAWGISGIAMSTALVYFVAFVYLTIMAKRALKKAESVQTDPKQGVQ